MFIHCNYTQGSVPGTEPGEGVSSALYTTGQMQDPASDFREQSFHALG